MKRIFNYKKLLYYFNNVILSNSKNINIKKSWRLHDCNEEKSE